MTISSTKKSLSENHEIGNPGYVQFKMETLKECHVRCKETLGELNLKCVEAGLSMNFVPCHNSKEDENRLTVPEVNSDERATEYEVESILDYARENGENWYLVKWKDWEEAFNTWEPEEHLKNSRYLIVEFQKQRKFKKGKHSHAFSLKYESEKTRQFARKILNTGDLATLLKFCGLTITEFENSGKTMKQLQKDLKSIVASLIKKEKITNKQYSHEVSKILRNGNGLRSELLDFFEKRQAVLLRLHKWVSDINNLPGVLVPIEIENNVDMEGPPENFTYITDYKAGEGIIIPDDPLVGCSCTDCFKERNSCCVAQSTEEYAYNKFGYLRVPEGTPIYECNKRCLCPADCSNRVVQKGRMVKLVIFRTHDGRGWGVKSLEKIKKGQFVMEYVGEVITTEEAENRGKLYDAEGRTYLFDLDFNEGDDPFTVDAAYLGNVAHFMNHSCEPNLMVYTVWINNLDPRLPRIAFFAKHEIKRGEELTFDYKMSGDSSESTPHRVMLSPYRSFTGTSKMQQDCPPTTPTREPVRVDNTNESDNSDDGRVGRVRNCDQEDKMKRIPCKCGANSCRKFLF